MTRVSDHAVVRYLERVKGMDIAAIRKEILPDKLNKMTKVMGSGYYPVSDAFKIRVKNGVVITVLKPKMGIRRVDPTARMTTRNKTIRKANKSQRKRDLAQVRENEQLEEAGLD